jgi:hypothetical protein
MTRVIHPAAGALARRRDDDAASLRTLRCASMCSVQSISFSHSLPFVMGAVLPRLRADKS